MEIPFLLAADVDFLKVVGMLLFIGIGVLSQIYNATKKHKPPARPADNPGGAPPEDRPLLAEIEAFLEGVRKEKAGGDRFEPPRPVPEPQRLDPRDVVRAEIVEARVIEPPRPGGSAAASSMGSLAAAPATRASDVGAASVLGTDIDQSDERVESRLHEAFDRQLGQFRSSTGGSASSNPVVGDAATAHIVSDDVTVASGAGGRPDEIAADLRRMLSEPIDVRKAIVLSEILTPPSARW